MALSKQKGMRVSLVFIPNQDRTTGTFMKCKDLSASKSTRLKHIPLLEAPHGEKKAETHEFGTDGASNSGPPRIARF